MFFVREAHGNKKEAVRILFFNRKTGAGREKPAASGMGQRLTVCFGSKLVVAKECALFYRWLPIYVPPGIAFPMYIISLLCAPKRKKWENEYNINFDKEITYFNTQKQRLYAAFFMGTRLAISKA